MLIAAVLLSTVATSCAPDAADSDGQINDVTIPKSGLWALSSLDPDAPWLPILASRDLAVGIQRLAFTLDPRPSAPPFDPANPPSIRASIYHLDQSQDQPRAVRFARFLPLAPSPFTPHAHAGSTVSDNASQISAGLYIIPLQLHAPGQWGILFQIQQDAANAEIPFRFSVRQRPAAPAVGDPAISVPTPTASDPASIAAISSDPNPEPGLYAAPSTKHSPNAPPSSSPSPPPPTATPEPAPPSSTSSSKSGATTPTASPPSTSKSSATPATPNASKNPAPSPPGASQANPGSSSSPPTAPSAPPGKAPSPNPNSPPPSPTCSMPPTANLPPP